MKYLNNNLYHPQLFLCIRILKVESQLTIFLYTWEHFLAQLNFCAYNAQLLLIIAATSLHHPLLRIPTPRDSANFPCQIFANPPSPWRETAPHKYLMHYNNFASWNSKLHKKFCWINITKSQYNCFKIKYLEP